MYLSLFHTNNLLLSIYFTGTQGSGVSLWLYFFMWSTCKVANIIHLYKNKGDHSSCDNHRGISLLSIAGKILARIMLNRITKQILDDVVSESQCGFRKQRGTVDMVFAIRQLQEKCVEQHKDLHLLFIDLTKAFDTVN